MKAISSITIAAIYAGIINQYPHKLNQNLASFFTVIIIAFLANFI